MKTHSMTKERNEFVTLTKCRETDQIPQIKEVHID